MPTCSAKRFPFPFGEKQILDKMALCIWRVILIRFENWTIYRRLLLLYARSLLSLPLPPSLYLSPSPSLSLHPSLSLCVSLSHCFLFVKMSSFLDWLIDFLFVQHNDFLNKFYFQIFQLLEPARGQNEVWLEPSCSWSQVKYFLFDKKYFSNFCITFGCA